MARHEKSSPSAQPLRFADLVLAELQRASRPLTGLQIRNCLAECGRSVRPSQVYRALSQLVDQGVLLHIRSTSSYTLQPAEESIVLICRKCGDHRLARAGTTAQQCLEHARNRQFDARQFVLEVGGLCSTCNAESPRRSPQAI